MKKSKAKYKKTKPVSIRESVEMFILSLPTLIRYVLFCYLPMFGLLIAFKRYRPAAGRGFLYSLFVNSEWAGLDNFRFLFANNKATTIRMFVNTIGYNIVFILLSILLPVTFAIILSNIKSQKLAKVCQSAMFIPYFLSWVVVGYFVYAFLSTDNGLINHMLVQMGRSPVKWYQAEALPAWPFILVLLYIWKNVGYGMVIYLAAIKGIDQTLYESAVIDGAGKWQQVKYITLPQIKRIIVIMFILSLGRIFNSDFGLFYQTTRNSSSLTPAFLTIDVYLFNALFSSTRPVYGYISAGGLLQSVLGCLTILVAAWIVKKVDPESAIL